MMTYTKPKGLLTVVASRLHLYFDRDLVVPAVVHRTSKFERYFHSKVLVLAGFTILLYVVKTFFYVELPEKYLSLVEHASLFSDLIFMGSSNGE